MSLDIHLTRTILVVCMLPFSALAQGTPDTASATAVLLDCMVQHQQGWGMLGIDHRAYDPAAGSGPLQIGDQVFTRGLGAHAPQHTLFALEGRFLALDAVLGVQKQHGSGSVVFRVLADDREVYRSGVVREDTPPIPLHLDLRDVQLLELFAEDAGDGINSDLANWADIRFTPRPAASSPNISPQLDIAPFARIVGFDPRRKHGTRTTRLEEWPPGDLYLETLMKPDAEGRYVPQAVSDDLAAIGLQWMERRRLECLVLRFPTELLLPRPEQIKLEAWNGPSRWQGEWIRLNADVTQHGTALNFVLKPGQAASALSGTLQVRWILPPQPIAGFEAWSKSACNEAEVLLLRTVQEASTVRIQPYNALILDPPEQNSVTWDCSRPLRIRLRYVLPRTWQAGDRSLLRLDFPEGRVTIALDTLLRQGSLYLPDSRLLVSSVPEVSDLASHLRRFQGESTVADRVQTMEDQTLERALNALSRRDAHLGPTLLSLPADNRKFLLDRNGTLHWSNQAGVFNHFETPAEQPFNLALEVFLNNAPLETITRHISDATLDMRTTSNLHVRFSMDAAQVPIEKSYYDALPAMPVSGHMEFSFSPAARHEDFALILRPKFNPASGQGVTFQVIGDRAEARLEREKLFTVFVLSRQKSLLSMDAVDGELRISGKPPHDDSVFCRVEIPRGAADTRQFQRRSAAAAWQIALAEAVRVTTPDSLLNRIIHMSQVHCLMAARNDLEGNVAPWIASMHYGPLESEAHSIIRGMMALGHQDFARRSLQYYVNRYNSSGFLTTGYTTMGTGWHLWTLGEYYQLYRDKAWFKEIAPEVLRVCRWVIAERNKTRGIHDGESTAESGLMPPGPLADWNLYAYYFYGNAYYAAGLRAIAEALADIGASEAAAIAGEAEDFAATLRRAVDLASANAPVVPLRNGLSVPFYPCQLYAPGAIGDLYPGDDGGRSWCYDVEFGVQHLVALGLVSPRDALARHTMNFHEDVQYLRDGWFAYSENENHADWFNRGGFSKVQPYYARTGETYARMDEPRLFLRTYYNSIASLLNPEDLSFWEHFFNGAYNKTHETGYFLYQTSQMLAQTRGDTLWIAPLIPATWPADDAPLRVENLPTPFGRISYRMTCKSAVVREVLLSLPKENPPRQIVLRARHPEFLRIADVSVYPRNAAKPHIQEDLVRFSPTTKFDKIRLQIIFEPRENPARIP